MVDIFKFDGIINFIMTLLFTSISKPMIDSHNIEAYLKIFLLVESSLSHNLLECKSMLFYFSIIAE